MRQEGHDSESSMGEFKNLATVSQSKNFKRARGIGQYNEPGLQ